MIKKENLIFLLACVSVFLYFSNTLLHCSYLKHELFGVKTELSQNILENYNGSIPTLWSCSKRDTNKLKKLIFVHVFKTAGTTVRYFFYDIYARKCRHAASTILCSAVTEQSLLESSRNDAIYWEKLDPTVDCLNLNTRAVNGREVISAGKNKALQHKSKVKYSDFRKFKVDIVVGHIPFGIDKYWFVEKKRVEAQYLTFVRDPIVRFVSSRLFMHRSTKWSDLDAVAYMQTYVKKRYTYGEKYNVYERYWLSPLEKETKRTEEETVKLIKQNLLLANPVIGVIEDMTASLAVLQSVIDPDLQLTKALSSLDLSRKVKGGGKQKNKSKMSSLQIVQILKRDKKWLSMVTDYLKHEYEVYDFCVRMHNIQVEAVANKFLYSMNGTFH